MYFLLSLLSLTLSLSLSCYLHFPSSSYFFLTPHLSCLIQFQTFSNLLHFFSLSLFPSLSLSHSLHPSIQKMPTVSLQMDISLSVLEILSLEHLFPSLSDAFTHFLGVNSLVASHSPSSSIFIPYSPCHFFLGQIFGYLFTYDMTFYGTKSMSNTLTLHTRTIQSVRARRSKVWRVKHISPNI